jgi:hypothetical protein
MRTIKRRHRLEQPADDERLDPGPKGPAETSDLRLEAWTKSTGPRTAAGKARAARNAWKGGHRARICRLSCLLSELARVAKI